MVTSSVLTVMHPPASSQSMQAGKYTATWSEPAEHSPGTVSACSVSSYSEDGAPFSLQPPPTASPSPSPSATPSMGATTPDPTRNGDSELED